MKRFVAGLIVGLLLGSAGGVLAFRPSEVRAVIAGDGELRGWDVVYRERSGRRLHVCSDPWIWGRDQEIECAGD